MEPEHRGQRRVAGARRRARGRRARLVGSRRCRTRRIGTEISNQRSQRRLREFGTRLRRGFRYLVRLVFLITWSFVRVSNVLCPFRGGAYKGKKHTVGICVAERVGIHQKWIHAAVTAQLSSATSPDSVPEV